MARASEDGATQVAHNKAPYLCSQCGNLFAMTAKEAQRREQTGEGGYICPSCDDGSALSRNPSPQPADGSSDGKQHRPRPGGGRQRVEP